MKDLQEKFPSGEREKANSLEECSVKAGGCLSSSRNIYKEGGVMVRKELERMGQDKTGSVFPWMKRPVNSDRVLNFF